MSVSRLELGALAAKKGWLGGAGLSLTLALAGCATPTAQQHYAHGHEYFSQAKYGHASPKVVADGQPVPRGGGQYLVGHPYTIAGHTYYPTENGSFNAVGMASWYGAAFHGRRTANGEVYDMASHHRRASDHAAAELRAGDQSQQRLFGDRARQRPRALSWRPGDGRLVAHRRRARFQGRRHRQDQGRICRPRAARRLRRQHAAGEPAHGWFARQSERLFRAGHGGERGRPRRIRPVAVAGALDAVPCRAGAASGARAATRADPRRRRRSRARTRSRDAEEPGRPKFRGDTGRFRCRRRAPSTSARARPRPWSPSRRSRSRRRRPSCRLAVRWSRRARRRRSIDQPQASRSRGRAANGLE